METKTKTEICLSCSGVLDYNSNHFLTHFKPMSCEAFAKKVCVLRKDKTVECINPCSSNYSAKDCSWETAKGLDGVSTNNLREIGIEEHTISELQQPYYQRPQEL